MNEAEGASSTYQSIVSGPENRLFTLSKGEIIAVIGSRKLEIVRKHKSTPDKLAVSNDCDSKGEEMIIELERIRQGKHLAAHALAEDIGDLNWLEGWSEKRLTRCYCVVIELLRLTRKRLRHDPFDRDTGVNNYHVRSLR